MLDNEGSEEVFRGTPAEGAHREIVGTDLVSSELLTKVGEGIEAVGIVETLAVFPVTAFDLAVVSGRVGPDQLMAYAQVGGGGFKERLGHLQLELADYVHWFNNIRLHGTLGYRSPAEFKKTCTS